VTLHLGHVTLQFMTQLDKALTQLDKALTQLKKDLTQLRSHVTLVHYTIRLNIDFVMIYVVVDNSGSG